MATDYAAIEVRIGGSNRVFRGDAPFLSPTRARSCAGFWTDPSSSRPPASPPTLQVSAHDLQNPAAGAKIVRRPLPTSPPPPGHARLVVKLRPVNPSDVFSLQGVYPGFLSAPGAALPAVPGIDGVAVVEALSPDDGGQQPQEKDGAASAPPALLDVRGHALSVGDRVVAATGFDIAHGQGSWQEVVELPASSLCKVPPGVSDAAAASFFVNPVTVAGLLEATGVQRGEWLIVTSALSALSKMLLAVCSARGVRTLAVVRREEAVAEALERGATAAVCWSENSAVDLAAEVRKAAGESGGLAHAAVDSVGGELTRHVTDAVRDGGSVFVYGAQGGLSASASIPALLFRDVRLRGFWLTPWLASLTQEGRARVIGEVWDEYYGKGLVASADEGAKTFPLSRFAEAVAESQRPARGGKVFLVNDD